MWEELGIEDEVAKELTQSLDLFEKKTGEDKIVAEQPATEEMTSELKIAPYEIPKEWKGDRKGKESIEMSDDEIYDESEYVSKALQYSRTDPAMGGRDTLEHEMGYSKGLCVCLQFVQSSFIQ